MLNKEEIVYMGENNQALTTSLMVAKKFGKEHKHVLDAIRNLLNTTAENSAFVDNQQLTKMFALVETEQPMPVGGGVKKVPMYVMNRDGFTLLAMGFTGEKALRFKLEYIKAFNAMEQQIREVVASYQISDPIKRAEKWIEEERERQRLQLENQQKEQKLIEQQPKVVLADAFTASLGSFPLKDLATILSQRGINIGTNRLYDYLRENYYLGERGQYRNVAYQKYVDQGLFEIEMTPSVNASGVPVVNKKTMVTSKGIEYFVNKFLNNKNNK